MIIVCNETVFDGLNSEGIRRLKQHTNDVLVLPFEITYRGEAINHSFTYDENMEDEKRDIEMLKFYDQLSLMNQKHIDIHYPPHRRIRSLIIDMMTAANETEILYFASPTIINPTEGDTVAEVLSELVNRYPNFKIGLVNTRAISAAYSECVIRFAEWLDRNPDVYYEDAIMKARAISNNVAQTFYIFDISGLRNRNLLSNYKRKWFDHRAVYGKIENAHTTSVMACENETMILEHPNRLTDVAIIDWTLGLKSLRIGVGYTESAETATKLAHQIYEQMRDAREYWEREKFLVNEEYLTIDMDAPYQIGPVTALLFGPSTILLSFY